MLLFILTIIILIGYIHAPHHASAILIFYAISVLVLVVTYRAAYYNLVHCFRECKRSADERTGTTTSDEGIGTTTSDERTGTTTSDERILVRQHQMKVLV